MGHQRVISFLLLFYLLSKFPESPALGDTVFLHKHSEAITVCPCTASTQRLPQGAQTPLFCQRSFLLGCPAPIRQGCLDVKDTQGTWNRPGRDVSWLPHLPVSGMVKLLSWGVTLGVLCVLLKCFCVHASMCVALGQERPIYKCTIYIKKRKSAIFFLWCVHHRTLSGREFKGKKMFASLRISILWNCLIAGLFRSHKYRSWWSTNQNFKLPGSCLYPLSFSS